MKSISRKILWNWFHEKINTFRSGGNEDCPNNVSHQLQCCAVPEYYYGHCESFGTDYGVQNSCLDHGNLILEGKYQVVHILSISNHNL